MVFEIVSGACAIGDLALNLLGWKAMPFALEDLDSNCSNCQKERAAKTTRISIEHTFVSMFGEDVDAILTAARCLKLTPRA